MFSRSPSLSAGTKAGYGVAELGVTAVEFFIQVYLLKFYTDVGGLRPSTVGLLLAVGTLWDALTDPLLGAVSDGTVSPWGKRRPYMALGAPLLAASFIFLFRPPGFESELAQGSYVLLVYILVNTSMTLLAVPHTALGGELSSDPHQRTSIFGWRFLFANGGLFSAILLPAMFASEQAPSDPTSAIYAIAAMLMLTTGISIFATRGLDHSAPAFHFAWRPFLKSIGKSLRNPLFFPLVLAFVVGSMGRTINASMALFYYDLRLNIPEKDVFLAILLPFTGVIALSIVFWVQVAKRIGRKWAAFWGIFGLGIMTCIAYPLLPPEQLGPPVLVGIMGGLLVGAVFLLDASVTDAADFDTYQTGKAQEGLYFGVWRLSSKLARALGLAISGILLDVIGFEPNQVTQAPEVTQGLAWLFGPGVGIFFIGAALILLSWPLTKRKRRQLTRARTRQIRRLDS